jgi:hypothetical protein
MAIGALTTARKLAGDAGVAERVDVDVGRRWRYPHRGGQVLLGGQRCPCPRETLKREDAALSVRLREYKPWLKLDNVRRHNAGFGSALHKAAKELLEHDIVSKLEARALELEDARASKGESATSKR